MLKCNGINGVNVFSGVHINAENTAMVPTLVYQDQTDKCRNGSNSRPPLQWKYRHPTEGICECGLVAQCRLAVDLVHTNYCCVSLLGGSACRIFCMLVISFVRFGIG